MSTEQESYDPTTTTGQSLMKAADAAGARGTLSLGSLATQNANNVTISGGSITGADVTAVEATETISADFTLTDAQKVVVADATNNSVVLTLPETPAEGQPYDIKAKTAGAYTVTVQKHAGSSHTIDGATSLVIPNGSARSLVYMGGDSWIIR